MPTLTYDHSLTLTANVTGFSVAGGTSSKTLTVSEDATIDQDIQQSAAPSFAGLALTGDVDTDRWLSRDDNTFFGVDVAGGDGLSHAAGDDGYYNTGFGFRALYSITSGYRNAAFGAYAGDSLTIGISNMLVGYAAGYNITTGGSNMCLGYQAGYNNQTGARNTCVGTQAGQGSGTQSHADNTYVGYISGEKITTGDRNTAIGAYSNHFNQSSSDNVCIGYGAGYGASGQSNQRNVFIGKDSGLSVTVGGSNVCIGFEAGEDITSGGSNVCIGNQAGEGNLTTDSNELWIANTDTATPLIYGEFDTGFIKINNHIYMLERSSDPTEPAEGECVVWMSDGSGKGDDGDVMIASQAGGTTNYGTLFDHSGGAGW